MQGIAKSPLPWGTSWLPMAIAVTMPSRVSLMNAAASSVPVAKLTRCGCAIARQWSPSSMKKPAASALSSPLAAVARTMKPSVFKRSG